MITQDKVIKVYISTGTSKEYAITFPYEKDEYENAKNIVVYHEREKRVLLARDVDYTIQKDKVVTTEMFPEPDKIIIMRETDILQQIRFVVQQKVDLRLIEEALDKLTLIAQELDERAGAEGPPGPQGPAGGPLEVGAIVPFGADEPPSGWLLCDGRAVSRTLYPDLFAAIGTKFGDGDGSTTFNLPHAGDHGYFISFGI